MKISNWSLAGFGLGILFAVGTFIRYYILYPDMDKAVTDIIIGLIICGIAWLYNKQLQHSNVITAIENYIEDKK